MSEDKITASAAIKGMFSFFTMLPINIEKRHMDSMNRKFWLVPIIGFFYAIMATAVFGAVQFILGPFIAAACTIASVGIMNRFLHFDGLIDIGDGLTVAGQKEDHVRALKDTLVGAGGVILGIVAALLLFAEYSYMSIPMFMIVGFSAELLARNSQVSAAAFGEPSNGMAGESVRHTDGTSLLKSSILSIILLAISLFVMRFLITDVFNWHVDDIYYIAVAIAFFVSVIWGWVISKIAMKNFGFVNGDVLGATNETSRIVMILVMIAVIAIYGLI